jgi:hypothetical protein
MLRFSDAIDLMKSRLLAQQGELFKHDPEC